MEGGSFLFVYGMYVKKEFVRSGTRGVSLYELGGAF